VLTSGLVITLSKDPFLAEMALAELRRESSIFLGNLQGRQCALVIESAGPDAAHDRHNWVSERLGVESTEVVFVDWQSDDAEVTHVSA